MFTKKKLLIPIILSSLILIGSFGFMKIEGWSFLDAFYMCVITLSTVGYGEVRVLSDAGRIFNIIYIIFGLISFTYFAQILIAEISSIDFRKRRRLKMRKKIKDFSNHTIICGFGRMGAVICRELDKQNIKFVVVEKRESLVHELKETDYPYIEGDAAHDENLLAAGVEKAKVLISVIDSDSDCLYIALAGRSLNPNLYIIARASEENAKPKMIRAGADKVVLPFVMSGLSVADSVLNPAVADLFDISCTDGDEEEKIQLADLFVTHASTIIDKTLKEIGPALEHIIIVGVRGAKDHEFHFYPKGSYRFEKGDCLITLASRKSYQTAMKNFNLSATI